jgi:hypothetical protein
MHPDSELLPGCTVYYADTQRSGLRWGTPRAVPGCAAMLVQQLANACVALAMCGGMAVREYGIGIAPAGARGVGPHASAQHACEPWE